MKYKWKRVLAVVFLFIIVAGWYVTVCGIGPVKPIQDRMKLGLDIKGGVYVVMEAKTDLERRGTAEGYGADAGCHRRESKPDGSCGTCSYY